MAKTAIRANQISDGSVDNNELKHLDGVTSAIQTQISAKVSKITSTDNAIPKFDGVTGEVQNSGVLIDDDDNVTMGNELKLGDGAATVKYNAVTESIDFIFV